MLDKKSAIQDQIKHSFLTIFFCYSNSTYIEMIQITVIIKKKQTTVALCFIINNTSIFNYKKIKNKTKNSNYNRCSFLQLNKS